MGMYPGGNLIKLSPTVATAAYGAADVIFDKQELKGIVPSRGGCSILHNITMYIDAAVSADDFALMFFDNDTGIGAAANDAVSGITDDEFQATGLIGAITFDTGNNGFSVGNGMVICMGTQIAAGNIKGSSMLLKAAEGKTSIWVAMISIGGSLDMDDADGMDLTFGVQYLG